MSSVPENLPPGPMLNRLVATLICEYTGGAPDENYPPFSTDLAMAFKAIDAFVATQDNVTVTIEYPSPEVWIKRYDAQFSSGWVPAAYIASASLPHAICVALLKAHGFGA